MKYVILNKTGMFYNAHNDGAFILHELFNYKCPKETNSTGFPESSLLKVLTCLENKRIGYKIYHKGNILKEYKGIDGEYDKCLSNAVKNLEMTNRVNALILKLSNCSYDKLSRIIELIENECQ